MNNLKVIQLLPELNIGGVERGTKDFSKFLVENGHESIVISNGGIFENDIVNHGAKHISLPIHKKSLFSFFLSNKLKTIYEKEKPDIVHVRSRMPAWINYFAFKKLTKKPILVSTFHGLYSTPIYSQVMSKVDHVIAISNTVKDYILNTYNVPKDKITTIPRGCEEDVFNQDILPDSWLDNRYEEYPYTKDKIILVDQHAAHERIVLEKLKSSYLNNKIDRQVLLMPEVLEIEGDIRLFLNNKEKIKKLGIIFEEYGENTLLVRELPGILGKISIKELFDDLYIQLEKFDEVNLNNYQIEKLFSSIACHNSIRAGRKLNIEEMNNLLRLMEKTPNSGQCNHGRPTFVELNIKDMEKLFGRT